MEEKVWKQQRYKAVYQAVFDKFHQSPRLARALWGTGNRFIIEAADYDPIFGIGLCEYTDATRPSSFRGCKFRNRTPQVTEKFDIAPENWAGQNLLGIALMEVAGALNSTKERYGHKN